MSKIEEIYNYNRETIMICAGNESAIDSKLKELISYVNNYEGFLSVKEMKSALYVIAKLINSQYYFSNFSFGELFNKIEEYYDYSEYERVKYTTNYFLNK